MGVDDASLFDAAVSVVARYGMKRATMADLASAVGVSRQTLYDRFGDKDGVMAAVIDHMTAGLARDLGVAFAERASLGHKLDAYFEIAVWPTFDLVRAMPDSADFERGMGPVSMAATRRSSDLKRAMLTEMLRAHLGGGGQPPDRVAAFVELGCSRVKLSDISRDDLASYLAVLREAVVALARSS